MTTQGTEARRGETAGLDAKRDGPFGAADAPQPTDNAETIMTDVQQAVPVAGEGGQDRKFAFRDGQFVNRVSGEPIPLDEPVIIFRARDNHSLPVLREYLSMASDPHHRQAIKDRMGEFAAWRSEHPDRVKEPGITHHIRLNEGLTEPAREADSLGEGVVSVECGLPAAERVDAVLAGLFPEWETDQRQHIAFDCAVAALTPTDPTHTWEAELMAALERVAINLGEVPFNDIPRGRAVVEQAACDLRAVSAALFAGSAQ